MIIIEINIDKIEYGTILNKPNQLIEINRTKITALQNSAIDYFLHKCQTSLHLTSDKMTDKDYHGKELECELDDFLSKLKGKSFELKDNTYLAREMESLQALKIVTKSKYKFKVQSIIPMIDIDFESRVIKFIISNDVITGLYRESKVIGDLDINDLDSKTQYTSYNYVSLNAYKFTPQERALYENLIRSFWSLFTYSRNSMKYNFKDFLEVVGIETDNTTYAKTKIKKIIEGIEKKTSMKIKYNYELGLYKTPKSILIKIIDYDISKNREIRNFFDKNKDLKKHEYVEQKTEFIDYFEEVVEC